MISPRNISMRLRDVLSSRHEPEAERLLASGYWSLLIILLVCMIVGGIGFGAWEFTRPLVAPMESEVTVGSAKAPLNRADLQKVIEGFDGRAERFEQRRAQPVTVRDPS